MPAGTVLVQYRNRDLQPHNLYAAGVAPARPPVRIVADAEPESTVEGAATLAAGRWELVCTIPGHESMQATIDVTA